MTMTVEPRTMTTDTLLYEAVQRVFRNAIVRHLRTILKASFPSEWLAALRKPFKNDEWDGIVKHIEESASLGLINRHPTDEFDYLSVNHFYNLFETHFLLLLPAEERPDQQIVPKVRQQVLAWFREVKAVRDPISHPPEEDLPAADALRTIDSARRILRKLHLRDADSRLSEIYEELIERISSTSSHASPLTAIDDTLPPGEAIVVDFVGRHKHLRELWEWLFSEESRRWVVVGDGGKGKTSIAYRFASDARESAISRLGLHGVFWLSAKRRRFAEGSVVSIATPDFEDLDSALNRILLDYGWADDVSKSTDAKRLTVTELLSELPVLLVIDDLDSLREEAEAAVEFFLLDAPRTRSKVLITSRRLYPGMGHSKTVVEGLAPEEATQFIESRIRLMEIPVGAIPPGRQHELGEMCDGSPLYIEDFLRLIRFLPFDQAMTAWKAGSGDDVRRYALQREMEMLSPFARYVLQVCSYCDGPVSVVELERISGRKEGDLVQALDELRQLFLVPVPRLIETVPRFQVNSNVALMVRNITDGTAQELPIKNAIKAVAGEDFGHLDFLVRDHVRQAVILTQSRRFEEAEATVQSGIDSCPNHPNLLGILGWVYSKWEPKPRLADARASWNRAFQLGSADRPMFMHWYFLEMDQGEYEAASMVADRALQRVSGTDAELLRLAGWARQRYGQALTSSLLLDRGQAEFRDADALLGRSIEVALADPQWRSQLSRAFAAWVRNARRLGNSRDECHRLQEWLRWDAEDPYALRETERMREQCPEALRLLSSLRAEQRRSSTLSSTTARTQSGGTPVNPGRPGPAVTVPRPSSQPRPSSSTPTVDTFGTGSRARIRLYELARELGLSNRETVDLCQQLGIRVLSHSSSIPDVQADRVRRKADRDGLRRPRDA